MRRSAEAPLRLILPSAFFRDARKDYGRRGKPRNHFAIKTPARPAATESGLARRTRRLTQIRNKNSSSACICVFSGQRPFFPCSKNPDGRNVWQRPGNMDAVRQLSINRWQKVLRMKQGWWNCCIEIEAAAKQFLEERGRHSHRRGLRHSQADCKTAGKAGGSAGQTCATATRSSGEGRA